MLESVQLALWCTCLQCVTVIQLWYYGCLYHSFCRSKSSHLILQMFFSCRYSLDEILLICCSPCRNLSMKSPRFLKKSGGVMAYVPIFILMVETLASCFLVPKIINSVLSLLHFNISHLRSDITNVLLQLGNTGQSWSGCSWSECQIHFLIIGIQVEGNVVTLADCTKWHCAQDE